MVKKRKKNKQENSFSTHLELPSPISSEKNSLTDIDISDVDIDKSDIDIDKSDVDIDKLDIDIRKSDEEKENKTSVKKGDNKKKNDSDYPSDSEIIVMEDLWNSTKPMPILETPKSRRLSLRRRSSGGSESDFKTAIEHLHTETAIPKNAIKRRESTSNLQGSTKDHLQAEIPENAIKRRGSTSNLQGSIGNHLLAEPPKNAIKRRGSTSNLHVSMGNQLLAETPKNAIKRRGSTSNLQGSKKDQEFFWDEVKESYDEP